MNIHPLAVVSSDAKLGRDVVVGPFCVIEPNVVLGDACRLASHVVVKSGVTMGARNQVFEGTVIGGLPQHTRMPDRLGSLKIGSDNTIREYCTIHRALHEGTSTVLGDNNLLMAGAHIAHDCRVGSHVIFANYALLGGHVAVDDKAFVSGAVGIHQFCRIGRLAMVGGHARVVQDVPPYVMVDGSSGLIVGLNLVGLRRSGYVAEEIADLKAAYRVIYRHGLKWTEVLAELRQNFSTGPAADFHAFLSQGTRGFVQERRVPPNVTLKLRQTDEAEGDLEQLRSKAG